MWNTVEQQAGEDRASHGDMKGFGEMWCRG